MQLPSKLPHVGTTIFAVMSKLASDHNAINLSQGFPDFDVDARLVALVEQQMRAGHNQYAPMQGLPLLRQRIAAKVASIYDQRYDPDTEITVTAGATEALFCAITAAVHPGDEVILFEPAYDSYAPAVELSGGVPVYIELKFPDYHVDWDEVRDALSPKTRMIILNTPHNPTGAVLTADDMRALIDITRDSAVLLLGDEVYEHIIFDGLRHESLARYPELAARSFVISSFGKTYHATGWKLGYCLAPQPLTVEFRKVHQFVTFACNTPMQFAYAAFLQQQDAYRTLPDFYQKKRDKFIAVIRDSRFRVIPCRGTYFQMLDYSAISNEPDMAFAQRLTIEHGVASIPPSVFYHKRDDHRVLRFCFAKKDETLEQAGEKLCSL